MLIGHVAAANDLHRIADGAKVLLIFHGEDSYVSPNWYPAKNRVACANLELSAMCMGAFSFSMMTSQNVPSSDIWTKHFETATNGDKAWKMADAPADFMLDMVQNIVGFQINIDTVQAKSKLSQNREMEDWR